ncbi:hypothetical protein EV652_114237 [Kribbella steppae]|uniref:Uncharacterized protein n=1 Tax=Kribbella steppae TaxID=2512223 RepID=A0A4V2RYC7_9ACTN|nr:hypothetical protein [Kribbella steppae]TCO19256.1 hypothetical protein EV652_114237 [Kribbella steppae]
MIVVVIAVVAKPDRTVAAPDGRGDGVAATPPAARTIDIPTSGWKPGGMSLTALTSGVLRATPEGCPYLGQRDPRSAGSRTPLVWPAGYTARYANDKTIEVLAPNGAVVAREGADLSAGGGLIPLSQQHPCTFGDTDAFVIMEDLTR